MPVADIVVTELTIDASKSTSGEREYSRAMDAARAAMERNVGANDRLREAQERHLRGTQEIAAANDNLARSYSAANDNLREAGKSALSAGVEFATTANHLKVAAVAAYAWSPAFRAMVNPAVVATVRSLGPAAVAAGGAVISAMSPALAFISRLAIPITLAVQAWKALNYVVDLGAGLLSKYANAGRSLYGNDVDKNLSELTRFQNDTILPQQAAYATQLGSRLETAKNTINDFFKVQFDLVDPALKLQNAWVVIVETLAKALTLAGQLPGAFREGAQAIGNSSIWNSLNFGWNLPGKASIEAQIAAGKQPDQSSEEAMALARSKLSAGLGVAAGASTDKKDMTAIGGYNFNNANIGSTFAARFTASINALAAPKQEEKTEKTRSEFDRFEKSLQRQAAAMEAESLAVGASVGEHARLRTELRLQEAALQDIAKNGGSMDDYAERIKKVSDRIGEATQKAAELKLQNDLTFERSQIGRDPIEANVASRLRPIYGNDYVNQMNSATAAGIRFNEQMRQAKDLTTEFVTGFAGEFRNQLREGANAWQAFSNAGLSALTRLSDKLMDMALSNLVAKAFGGSSGFNLFNLFGGGNAAGNPAAGAPVGYSGASAMGNVFDRGMMIHPYALGGIMSDILFKPTLFPMANGHAGLAGEAGPEAIMPLRRGADGRLGVQGGNAGGGGQHFHYHDNRVYNDTTPAVVSAIQARDRQEWPKKKAEIFAEMAKKRGGNPNFYQGG